MESNADQVTSLCAASSSSATNIKMNYALQVALQTMKERCVQLQRHVSAIEEENRRLREGSTNGSSERGDCSDNFISLRAQVDDLQRQKEQLEDQISMVSKENRKLWSRLSKISKDQAQLPLGGEIGTASQMHRSANTSMGSNQNLIRSKTFTQHSPSSHLRQKRISDSSLEDITLGDFNADEELGYPYGLQLHDATISNLDANIDARQCMEGLQDLRREAMKQQQILNIAVTQLESRIALQPCHDCTKNSAKKTEMADKSLETEDRLRNEIKQYQHENSTNSQSPDTFNEHSTIPLVALPHLNIIQEKLKADAIDKTCPMCGKLYSSHISFKAFQEHVETHFIDDTADADASVERQFEFISHAVGDF
ncbi:hypothetical protein KR044_002498 [Drosophila immigrans]|nr:hypothetical protein KR044_002498 [Drosophila immigrans]